MKISKFLLMTILTSSLLLVGCNKKDNNSNGNNDNSTPDSKDTTSTDGHEHRWDLAFYEWTGDYSKCTATRVCTLDRTHIETETVSSVYTIITAPTCEENGLGNYAATFTNPAFDNQSLNVTLAMIDHDWEEPTYEWSSDYSTCTATMVCRNNSNHVETETRDSVYEVLTPETLDEDGLARYTVNFTNTSFATQIHEVVLPKDVYATNPHLFEVEYYDTIKYCLYPQSMLKIQI